VKNRRKSKAEHELFVSSVIFRSNKIRLSLETHPSKLCQ